jgi:hypothetical protein
VIVAAFVGNVLIIVTVGGRKRELRVPRNMLILNLALADLRKLTVVCVLPLESTLPA